MIGPLGRHGAGCYSQAALSSNDSKTLYLSCCLGKQGELSENCLPNLTLHFMLSPCITPRPAGLPGDGTNPITTAWAQCLCLLGLQVIVRPERVVKEPSYILLSTPRPEIKAGDMEQRFGKHEFNWAWAERDWLKNILF